MSHPGCPVRRLDWTSLCVDVFCDFSMFSHLSFIFTPPAGFTESSSTSSTRDKCTTWPRMDPCRGTLSVIKQGLGHFKGEFQALFWKQQSGARTPQKDLSWRQYEAAAVSLWQIKVRLSRFLGVKLFVQLSFHHGSGLKHTRDRKLCETLVRKILSFLKRSQWHRQTGPLSLSNIFCVLSCLKHNIRLLSDK